MRLFLDQMCWRTEQNKRFYESTVTIILLFTRHQMEGVFIKVLFKTMYYYRKVLLLQGSLHSSLVLLTFV